MNHLNRAILLKAKKEIEDAIPETITCHVQFVNTDGTHVRLYSKKYNFQVATKNKPHRNSYVVIENDTEKHPDLNHYTLGVITAFDSEIAPNDLALVHQVVPFTSSITHYKNGYSPLQNTSDIQEWDKVQKLLDKLD